MNLNNRKISSVRVHAPYHIIGVANLESPIQSKADLILDITKVEGGVHILASKNGKKGECFIPDANCNGMTLIPETK